MVVRLVHCHIGSLEKYMNPAQKTSLVHCHIGSLENPNEPDL